MRRRRSLHTITVNVPLLWKEKNKKNNKVSLREIQNLSSSYIPYGNGALNSAALDFNQPREGGDFKTYHQRRLIKMIHNGNRMNITCFYVRKHFCCLGGM